ncbi:dockerin type I domain-containing protein [Ruminococcus sp.]|uniref:dockerin type I domain-containing protein n=1 Tax=Ruminococcus sp. TaxID=41978 RepID=UPI0025FA0094|nr:dockerin type I domain-containing protein [Ruminococcus sp.]
MRCKRILAAAVSVVMAAGQFSVGAFADDSDENSNAAAYSADDETTMEQDVILLNAEPNTYSAGDVNGDGKINVTDIIKIAAHIKSTKLLSGKGLAAADVNGDNVVNVTDITMIAAHIKGKRDISVYNELPIVKNPREKQTDVTLIEFNVDKNTKTVSWNAAADMKSYTVEFTNGDKTKTTNTSSTSASIPYDMFKDGKLTVTITPARQVKTEDGTRTYDYGDTIGYLLKIKPGKISGNITVTDDNGKAKIDWKAADFAAGYHVYDITNTATDGKPKLIADTDTDQLITDFPTSGTVKLLIVPFNSVGEAEGANAEMTKGSTKTDPVADLAAPTFSSYYYNSDTTTATLMWNAVSGAEGYEASIQIDGKWVAYDAKAYRNYKFTNLAQGTGFKTRVRAYKTVNGQKAYGKYSTTVTIITDAYVKCVTATPIYASQSTGSTKLGNLSVGDTVLQTDLPTNGWTKIFLPNSNGTQVGYVPTSCLSSNTNTDPVADLAAPTFSSYYYNSDTTTATLMWNAVSGAEGYEASIQIDGKWKAYDAKTARNYKFTGLAQGTGFKTRVRAYKTVNGQKAYGKYSTTVTVITDAYVKCVTATPIYASQSTGSTKLGNLSVGDTVLQTDLPTNGWTKIFLPNSNGTQVGYVPTSCLSSNTNTDPVADLAAPTFSSYYYNSDTTTATLMWNAVSGAEGYEASIQIDGKWVAYDAKAYRNYKFTNLAQGTGFKTRVRAYKTVNGQKAYGKYSTTVTVITDAYVKCVTATPIYASQSTGSTKLGNLSVGDTVLQTDLPTNGWTKIFLPNSNGTQVGYVPTSCLSSNTNTDPVADLAAPTFSSYYYNSDTTTATLMWNAVSGAEGYEASIQIDGKWVAYDAKAYRNYKFTNLAQGTGFKTRVRAYKTVNGQKAYGKYSTTVTVITDAYVKCVTATPIYASQSNTSTKLGNLSVGDTVLQTDLPTNGWTKIFLPNSNGTQVGYVPTSCLSSNTNTDPVADLAAPTFSSYFYNSDTTTATLMWNAVSGAEGYEASIQIDGKWVAYNTTNKSYKFTNLASGTGFKTRVRAYKTVNGQKAYGKYSTTVTVITDAYVKCVTATPIYASQSTGSTKLGNLSVGDTVLQTDLPTNGWTKIFLPNSNGTQVGYVPTSCLSSNTNTDPVADLAAPTFSSYYYNSDTTTATLMWNAVSGAEGYEASIQIDGKWVAYNTTNKSYKFTNLAQGTGFKTRVRAYKTVNGQKAYGKYSTTVTVITDAYVKCVTATPIYASQSTGSTKLGNLSVGDTVLQTDLPTNGWTKIFLPNSNGTQVGYVPTSCLNTNGNTNTDPVADLAAPTFSSYYYNSDTTTATLMWNAVSGAEGYEASIQIDGKLKAYDAKTARNYKFTGLASRTGFKTRVRAYKTVNGQKAYSNYSTVVTVITDGYVKCVTATPIYASANSGSSKIGNLSKGDIVLQTDLPSNGWTKIFLPNSNGTKAGYIPTSSVKNYSNSAMTVISQDGYLGGSPAVLGCEETALASVLNYQFGINVSKNTLIDYYMPEQAFSNGTINVDPNYCFWGSPYHMEGSVGYGCYAPLVAQSAHQYLKYIGVRNNYNIALYTDYYTGNNVNNLKFDPSKLDLGNTTVSGGLDLDGLKAEIDKGKNPIVWYSEIEPYAVCTQTLTAGQTYTNPGSGTYNFTWYGRQHTVVLTGYDDANNCFIIGNVENFNTSSYYGVSQTISYDFFMSSYTTLGRQSVVITKK